MTFIEDLENVTRRSAARKIRNKLMYAFSKVIDVGEATRVVNAALSSVTAFVPDCFLTKGIN